MEIKTINSSKITWYVINPSAHDFFQAIYCADGDGIVELVDYGDHYMLRDQLEIVKVWQKFDEDELSERLEDAQNYLAATYNEIFKSSSF